MRFAQSQIRNSTCNAVATAQEQSSVKASFEKLASNFAEVLNSYLPQLSASPQKFLELQDTSRVQSFISQDKLEDLVNKFEQSVRDVMQIRVPDILT